MLTNVKVGGIRCVEIFYIKNKTGIWGQSPSRRRPMVALGRIPDAAAIL